jgi:HSP20 family protein
MFFTPVASPSFRRAAYTPALHTADSRLERFLREAMLAPTGASGASGAKACQFEQDDASYTLTLDTPGLAKEHLTIGIEGAVVRIESLADAPRSLKVAYELPQDIDVATSEAKLELGVLTLKLVKKQPVSNVSSLTIN